ncbi:PA3371 family protein [Pseudomonas sp. RIT-PI-S]|uniref:PA3371 family protein n=1 Tax=Pseudomonas sp. RIT-PI-S TaxID=3035295 RepID=UPI0021D87318|nr:PA3371 family protein [Pseudomonas sp. RIT-PI-S]
MSRSAMIFLSGTLLCFLAAAVVPYPASIVTNLLLSLSLGCAVLFVLALIRGKRIRFNPQLR